MTDTTVVAARQQLHHFLSSTYHLPDLEAVDLILAAYRSHYYTGIKPVWLWVVGTSGSGKTEIGLRCLEGLPLVHQVGELTPQAFLSGKKGSKGLLSTLHKLPDGSSTGVLSFKDFTTFLSMRREDRTKVIAQMREIGDGKFTKFTGESGALKFHGKVSVIAACTQALEHAWGVHRNMGDRFVTIRWRDSDGEACAIKAQEHDGHEDEYNSTIISLAAKMAGRPQFTAPPPIPSFLIEPLASIASLSCWLRTPVHRDEYSKKLDDVSPQEKPTRMVKAIRGLLAGYVGLFDRDIVQSDLKVVHRIAMDSVPLRRFKIVDSLRDDEEYQFSDVMLLSGIPRTSLQRELEELAEIGILTLSTRKTDDLERTYVSLTTQFSQHREIATSPFR